MADNKDIENQKELNSEVEKNLSFEEEILFILNKRRGIDGETLKDQQDINNVLTDQTKQLKFQAVEKNRIKSLSSQISKIASSTYSLNREELGLTKTNNALIKSQLDLDKSIQSLTLQQNKLYMEGGELNNDIAVSIGLQIKEASKLKDEISNIQEDSEKISNSFGSKSFGGLSNIVKSIPGLKGLSGPFEEAAEAARKQGEFNLENFGQTKGLTKQQKIDNKLTNDKLKTYKKLRSEGMGIGKSTDKNGKIMAGALKEAGLSAKQVKVGKLPVKSIGTFKAGFKSLGPVIAKAMGPLILIDLAVKAIKFFVDAMFSASKATAEMSRNMLISRESAKQLYTTDLPSIVGQYNEIQKVANGTTITTTAYTKALGDINSKLGLQLDLTRGFGKQTAMNVAEVAKMQVNFGLSADASTQLFMESVKTGTSLEDNNKEIFGTLGLMSVQSGIQVDMNKTIEEAAAIQGNLRANFKGSTANLAAAVFQAKLLGLNLSQVAGAGEKLLDFESSIGAEMEAELLTGKQLNLEKAREYALMGKTDLLMKEISEQAGTQEDFLKMNVIQRKALAKAVGLEVNELADMYDKQAKMDALAKKNLEIKNALMKDGKLILDENFDLEKASLQEIQIAAKAAGKSEAELRDILGDQIYDRKQQEDASQKFAKALEQAKDAFVRLVDGGSLDKLADILTGLTESALFSGFAEEGEAKRISKTAIDAKNEQDKVAKALNPEGKSESELRAELGDEAYEKRSIEEKKIKDQQQLLTKEASLSEKALEAQSQATGIDDATDVGASALVGAGAGAAIGAGFFGIGAVPGAIIGGIVGGASAAIKNWFDQGTADDALAEVRNISTNEDAEAERLAKLASENTESVDDFILRPGQSPIKFNKDDLLIGGTNLGGSGSNSSNNEVATLLKELLSTVKKGGNVYMDGALVGSATTLAYNKL